MNTERIRELAEQAKAESSQWLGSNPAIFMTQDELEKFAELVAAEEREACAKACEKLVQCEPPYTNYFEGAQDCADAIRARGNE